ncbi:MAG: collagen-like protein, partial [Pricia sp.]
NIAVVLGAFLTLFIVSCEGDPGPPGRDGLEGPQGPAGEGEFARVFEVDGVDFVYIDEQNLYETILTFDDFTSFDVQPNDGILVYQFDRAVDFDNGNTENVWNLIPQSFFTEQGTVQFTSGYTATDVEILISGNFDLIDLDTGFTQDQIFRIVIVPGIAAEAKMDKANIASVMSTFGLSEKDVQKIQMD